MKPNPSRQNGDAFANLRATLSRLNLPPDLIDDLIERHITVNFEKGAWAFSEGNTDGMLAYIISGYVNVYCPVGDGNRTLVRMAGPGEIIGYPEYVDERGRTARMFEAQVASKCTLALVSRDHLKRLLAGLPADRLITILTALNTFWSKNLWFFTTLLSLPLFDRLTIVLSDLAKRLGVRDSQGIVLIPEIYHDDLAEMIGCSRPMISRLIGQMTESGQLARRGKQYVLLKKWDFDNNLCVPEKSREVRRPVTGLESVSSRSSSASRFQRTPQVAL
jgi:CRP/FNR family transcriptional regulator, cyclic AMP receptor protein